MNQNPPTTNNLDTEVPHNNGGHSYRLQEISAAKKRLEDERDKRAVLYKKYKRGVNVMDGANTALISASTAMSVAGAGLLATIVAVPIVLGLEIAALTCGTFGIISKFASRRLSVKARKHDSIRVLSMSKLNTISNLVSAALMDGKISDEEFRLIMSEIEKFQQMKNDIRTKAVKAHSEITIDAETKKLLIEKSKNI